MTHWTHLCMNCGGENSAGIVTTVDVQGKCDRCGSEAVTMLDPVTAPIVQPDDAAAQLILLKALHQEVLQGHAAAVAHYAKRIADLEVALRAYRTLHTGKRKCKACVRADELLAG